MPVACRFKSSDKKVCQNQQIEFVLSLRFDLLMWIQVSHLGRSKHFDSVNNIYNKHFTADIYSYAYLYAIVGFL